MKRLPAFSAPIVCFTRSKKYCLKIFGSSVVPDLLETINKVFARSTFFSKALTCAGSVESSTCNWGKPDILPKVSANTSAQTGAAHAQQQDVGEIFFLDARDGGVQFVAMRDLFRRDIE